MTGLLIAFVLLALIFGAFMVTTAIVADRREKAWAEERRELLTRIQHPQIVQLPAARRQPARTEPPEDDEYDLVGTVADDPGPEDGS